MVSNSEALEVKIHYVLTLRQRDAGIQFILAVESHLLVTPRLDCLKKNKSVQKVIVYSQPGNLNLLPRFRLSVFKQ